MVALGKRGTMRKIIRATTTKEKKKVFQHTRENGTSENSYTTDSEDFRWDKPVKKKWEHLNAISRREKEKWGIVTELPTYPKPTFFRTEREEASKTETQKPTHPSMFIAVT